MSAQLMDLVRVSNAVLLGEEGAVVWLSYVLVLRSISRNVGI